MLKIAGMACLGVALIAGCSDDNNSPSIDGPTTPTFDAKVADAGPTIDGGTNSVTVNLTKAGEPTPCGNDNATGTATVTVNNDNSIHVVVTYANLSGSGNPAMGHIHFGGPSDSGPVVLPFVAPGGGFTSPITADFTSSSYINGGTGNPTAPADYASFVTMMKAGGHAYINLHTAGCPNGEIRGEIPAIGQ